MDTIDTLDAKRQLVADLKIILDAKFEARDSLEGRAIELFKFSSVILGIVAGLGISISEIHGNMALVFGFVLLIVVYFLHVFFLIRVFNPSLYSIVPGIPRLATTYDDFRESYIVH